MPDAGLAPLGNRNALKHGLYTKEMRELNELLRELMKSSKETLNMEL